MSTLAPPAPGGCSLLPEARALRTPLAVVLAFTAINSLCAGLLTSGLFFAARAGYGFGPAANYGLGVLIGATYTVGALCAARVVARARGRARTVACGIVTVLGIATLWPQLLPGQPLAIWLVALCYGPTVAMLWPIVQGYVGGGRRGRELRAAVGAFNLTWGSALVVGFGLLGPLLETAPERALLLLGGLHIASLGLLPFFTAAPAEAGTAAPAVPEARDLELRRVMQGLLPLTNVLGFALAPFLPEAFARLGLPSTYRASFAVAWLLPRALAFGLLGRWHGWHGRFATAWVGSGLLVLGFALAFLAPWAVDLGLAPGLGLGVELVGLAAFGLGMATVYTAAFYYAQAVGSAAVGAGGRHEALLGAGATVGPLLGLLGAALIDLGWLDAASFEPALVAACILLSVGLAWRALRR
jgi:hypothetical protein